MEKLKKNPSDQERIYETRSIGELAIDCWYVTRKFEKKETNLIASLLW